MVSRSSFAGVFAVVLACATCAVANAQATVSPAAQAPSAPAAEQSKPEAPRTKISLHDRNEAEKAFLEGAKALKRSDLRAAVKEFDRAFHLDPLNRDYS